MRLLLAFLLLLDYSICRAQLEETSAENQHDSGAAIGDEAEGAVADGADAAIADGAENAAADGAGAAEGATVYGAEGAVDDVADAAIGDGAEGKGADTAVSDGAEGAVADGAESAKGDSMDLGDGPAGAVADGAEREGADDAEGAVRDSTEGAVADGAESEGADVDDGAEAAVGDDTAGVADGSETVASPSGSGDDSLRETQSNGSSSLDASEAPGIRRAVAPKNQSSLLLKIQDGAVSPLSSGGFDSSEGAASAADGSDTARSDELNSNNDALGDGGSEDGSDADAGLGGGNGDDAPNSAGAQGTPPDFDGSDRSESTDNKDNGGSSVAVASSAEGSEGASLNSKPLTTDLVGRTWMILDPTSDQALERAKRRVVNAAYLKVYEAFVTEGKAKDLMPDPFYYPEEPKDNVVSNKRTPGMRSDRCKWEDDYDYIGTDVATLRHSSEEACCAACRSRNKHSPGSCEAAVLSSPKDDPPSACWIKTAVKERVHKVGVVACLPADPTPVQV